MITRKNQNQKKGNTYLKKKFEGCLFPPLKVVLAMMPVLEVRVFRLPCRIQILIRQILTLLIDPLLCLERCILSTYLFVAAHDSLCFQLLMLDCAALLHCSEQFSALALCLQCPWSEPGCSCLFHHGDVQVISEEEKADGGPKQVCQNFGQK